MARIANRSGAPLWVPGHAQWEIDEERDVNDETAAALLAHVAFALVVEKPAAPARRGKDGVQE